MICETEEQCVELAVRAIKGGHKVMLGFGKLSVVRPVFLRVAARLPDSLTDVQGVILNGERVVVGRVPFMPGSTMFGWRGAMIIHPSAETELYGDRRRSLLDLVNRTNSAAGFQA